MKTLTHVDVERSQSSLGMSPHCRVCHAGICKYRERLTAEGSILPIHGDYTTNLCTGKIPTDQGQVGRMTCTQSSKAQGGYGSVCAAVEVNSSNQHW